LRGVLVCHCSECRRWCGQAWAATAARREEIVLVRGSALRWVASPRSATRARRGFCVDCGSCLLWDAPGRDTISLAAGSLDEPAGLAVVGHTYVEQAAGYDAPPDDGAPRYARLPAEPPLGTVTARGRGDAPP
jgi:hypothetical protein